ncbi:cobalamin-dependent protein [Streptomyces sp. CdTB01]|uniref:cobalamin B12-binding domain-containing protein n=1 Tax=Streptomyces sp. CdTB01 TaxID=1725411 RepID=UPI00073A65A4|nr:cobalamin-dependent protein [Streptomyces sp. CdTB01]ALV31132.1 methylaspartate mutase [Streptomyces sp. CdTB01]
MADLSRPAGTAADRAHTPARATVVVTTVASDSHTWNLVYLQLLLEELGYEVVNLGPCVPDELLVHHCREIRPAAVVISSVNGHGAQDGLRVIRTLREDELTATLPVAIGGKLGVDGGATSHTERLLAAGFDAVFEDGADTLTAFRRFLDELGPGADRALESRAERAAVQRRHADEQMSVSV